MTKKRHIRTWVILLVLLVTGLAIWGLTEQNHFRGDEELQASKPDVDQRRNSPGRPTSRAQTPNGQAPLSLVAVDPPEASALPLEYPPFLSTGGVGGRFAIRNRQGRIIWQGTEENPVYDLSISPNGQLIWVSGGDVKSYLINAQGEEVGLLPMKPPGRDKFLFSRWLWLDDERLLGVSALRDFDAEGEPLNYDHSPENPVTCFYVYEWKSRQLRPLQLIPELVGQALSLGRIHPNGAIQISPEAGAWGWYRIQDLGEGPQ